MIRYLDDEFKFSFTGLTVQTSGTYQYTIHQTISYNYNTIFTGLVWINAGATGCTIDATEIIRNYAKKPWLMEFDNPSNMTDTKTFQGFKNMSDKSEIRQEYFAMLNVNGYDFYSNSYVCAPVFRYPNYKDYLKIPYKDMLDMVTDEFTVLLQGGADIKSGGNDTLFLPHYPYLMTSRYFIPFVMQRASTYEKFAYKIKIDGNLWGTGSYADGVSFDSQYFPAPSTEVRFSLANFYNFFSPMHDRGNPKNPTYIWFEGKKIGMIDSCPARYYLMWQDRGGAFQSQPFNDKGTYSESFERSTTTNYKGEKLLKNITVQSKWKINSDWIDEKMYPIYESIYVSPKLLLYDSKEDNCWFVNVKGDYTEKTFRNQKSLFNITLELEENITQKILY